VLAVDRERRRVSLTAVAPGQAKRGEQAGPAKRPSTSSPARNRPAKVSQTAPPPKRTGRPPAKAKPKPRKPITQAMVDGQEPMRSFSDLLQFFERKRDDQGPNASRKQ